MTLIIYFDIMQTYIILGRSDKMQSIFDSFLSFDLSVFQWIQGIQNDFLDALMVGVTTLGNAGVVFIVLGLVLLFTKKYRKAGLAVLVALLVMLLCNDLFLKEFFARVRPFNLFQSNPEKYAVWGTEYIYPELVYKPSSYSFPSGHTSSSFSAAVAIFRNLPKKYSFAAIILASLIAFSRLYLYVHYPTDVLASVVLGVGLGVLGTSFAKKLPKGTQRIWWRGARGRQVTRDKSLLVKST